MDEYRKTSNILVTSSVVELTGRQMCQAKLSDFGTAELICERTRRLNRHGFTGTIEYTAPELLEIDAQGNYRDDYDMKSDMWSLGVILYALCYARIPYSHADPQKCREMILGHTKLTFPEYPSRSDVLKYLIEALTAKISNKRPSTDDILAHPIVRQILNDRQLLEMVGEQLAEAASQLEQKKYERNQKTPRQRRTSRTCIDVSFPQPCSFPSLLPPTEAFPSSPFHSSDARLESLSSSSSLDKMDSLIPPANCPSPLPLSSVSVTSPVSENFTSSVTVEKKARCRKENGEEAEEESEKK